MTETGAKDGYIPARKRELLAAIRAENHDGAGLEDVLKLLAALMHYESQGELETLRELYEGLDPDAPAVRRDPSPAAFSAFEKALIAVLDKANFKEIEPDTVETRTATKLLTGLSIKASQAGIRSIRFFARGAEPERIEVKTWFGLRKRIVEASVLSDVVVLVAFKSDSEIGKADKKAFADVRRGVRPGAALVKHFRNVASAELVTLHPGATPSMRPRDQVFLAGPAVVAGTPVLLNLWPAVTVLFAVVAAYFGARGEIEESDLKRAIAAISGLVAVGAFVMRQKLKYEAQNLRYQKKLADTVYFRNVSNNAGVLDLMVGAAEDQDVKEALLAYATILKADKPLTREEVDAAAEAFLRQRLELDVDFEVHDALAKLERYGLVTRAGEAYCAINLDEARQRLDATWDAVFAFAPSTKPSPAASPLTS